MQTLSEDEKNYPKMTPLILNSNDIEYLFLLLDKENKKYLNQQNIIDFLSYMGSSYDLQKVILKFPNINNITLDDFTIFLTNE